MPDFHIVTLFPDFFNSPLASGLLGKAVAKGLVGFSLHNPRDFSPGKYRHVDDAPYGGGPGMIIQAGPVIDAVRSVSSPGRIILLTPGGRPLTSKFAAELAGETDLTLICGRYEGIDTRVTSILAAEEVSVGEAILNGGETAAMAVIESVCRFVPKFLGREESSGQESFSGNLLEFGQYTRPEIYDGHAVPPVLLGGNHAEIESWRRRDSLARTLAKRPDLLADASLTVKDSLTLSEMPLTRPGRNLGLCLMHYPVRVGDDHVGVSSLTNLDIHDIARISRSYGLAAFYVLTPLPDQLALLRRILDHWRNGPNPDRAAALSLVRPVTSFEEMETEAMKRHGAKPRYIAASAQWPKKAPLTPAEIRDLCRHDPVILCLGTARGLSREAVARCDGQVRPLRFLSDNHLSVRSAAAILVDRILGDFC